MGEHKSKKRKMEPTNGTPEAKTAINGDVNVSRHTAIRGRQYTVSVAVPGSILAGASTQDLKTQLAGQIARALSIFSIDEVIVFDDGQSQPSSTSTSTNGHVSTSSDRNDTSNEYTGTTNPTHFLAHVLTYLETPPYLRAALFPLPQHANLHSIAIIPSLDLPHHTASTKWQPFREAVSRGPSLTNQSHSLLDIGTEDPVLVSGQIPKSSRVTLRFPAPAASRKSKSRAAEGEVEAVGPTVPREEAGQPWGYQVRTAPSLSAVITECGYDGGYDLSWGISGSGSGSSGSGLGSSSNSEQETPAQEDLTQALDTITRTRTFYSDKGEGVRHMLLVLGNGPNGLERAASIDEELASLGVAKEVQKLFDYWVALPRSVAGGAVLRTEEALWMVLMGLSELVMC